MQIVRVASRPPSPMRVRFICVAAFLVCLAGGLNLHAATKTIVLNAADIPGSVDLRPSGCLYPSADGGMAFFALRDISFDDPVPLGSVVTQIDLRVSFMNGGVGSNNDRGSTYFALNVEYDTQFAERLIGSALPSAAPPQGTCGGDPPYVGFEWKTISGLPLPDGLPYYRYGNRNDIMALGVATGTEPSQNFGVDHPYVFVENIEITLHYDPPPAIEFDITDSSAEDDRKILIHRWSEKPEYDYPSRHQRLLPGAGNADRDRRIEVAGTVRNANGSPAANRIIELRVDDPPDPSPYIPAPERLPGDNAQFGGVLDEPVVTTDNNGRFRTVLTGSEIAGDNYQIEATTIPFFGFSNACNATNNCYKSGVITNWKRIYLEVHKMFRRGSFLTAAVAPGDTILPVEDVDAFPTPPFRVRLIHAPEIFDGNRLDFYSDEVEVQAVIRFQSSNGVTAGELRLRDPSQPDVGDVVPRAYAGPETPNANANDTRIYLADAVGVVNGTSSAFETVDFSLIAPLFAEAFVEYVQLADENHRDWTHPSYSRLLPRIAAIDSNQREWLTRKWIRNALPFGTARVALPNIQFTFLGNRPPVSINDPGTRGLTTVTSGFNDTWIFAGMTSSVGMRREVLAHELGHQWLVNDQWFVPHTPSSTPGGHCNVATGADRFMYNHSGLRCIMHSALYGDTSDSSVADGIVAFHFIKIGGQNDSEYLRIRRRAEPVPQTQQFLRSPK